MWNDRKLAEALLKYYADYQTKDEFASACVNTLLLGWREQAEVVWEVIDVMEERREGDGNE